MGIRVANKIWSARQTRQPTVSAAKTKQRYKKRRNCKHKKSGCVCFIVVRLCAAPLRNWGIWANKALCAAAESTAKLRTSAKTHKNNRNKIRIIFFRFEHSIRQNAERRNETARSLQQTRGLFTIFPPTSLGTATIRLLLPHHSHVYAPARVYAHSAVFRLLPSPFTSYPYSIQNVTIRGEGFAFVCSSPSSLKKRHCDLPTFQQQSPFGSAARHG